MEEMLNLYYVNDAKKLRDVVNRIFNTYYGGTHGKDMDEYYGVATDALMEIFCNNTYDPSKGDFHGYVYNAIRMAIIDEFKRQNRDKRKSKIFLLDESGNKVLDEKTGRPIKMPIPDVSLDAPIKEGESITYGDMIQSDFDMDNEIGDYEVCIDEYLESLSDMQREIALLIMKGYEAEDIKRILCITDKQYKDCWCVITSYDKKRILYKEGLNMEDKTMNTIKIAAVEENVTEKYKNTSYSIESISKQLNKKRIRDDHILQRHSGQWKGFAKSELVSDILRGKSLTQIIISEEIKNGIKMQWLIDGKQRCTTLDDYLHDGFSISRNVKNYNITYQAPKTNESGDEILNEDGFTDMEWKSFDIRGKKFSQLPDELQDIFKDRQIPVLYNMDCTKKDIADDIARFNRSRPMNKAQNGWLGLEEEFAEFVDNIGKMQFFQPEFSGSAYTKNNITSGAIRRIIVESIMVSDFIDEFGDFDKMCEFLSEEASDSNFTEFYSLVDRLTTICQTKDTAELFDAKDSFLWFGLFSRFSKLGLSDERFTDFTNEFNLLRKVKLGGKSFDDILEAKKGTKDKNVVIEKLDCMEKLMKRYFNIDECNTEDESKTCNSIEAFVAESLGMDIEAIWEDIDVYKESLDTLLDGTVKLDSKLRDEENMPSMLAIMAYSYKTDRDLDKWMEAYAREHGAYFKDQRQNFIHMRDDFDKFCNSGQRISA